MRTVLRRGIRLLIGVLSMVLLACAQIGPQSGDSPDAVPAVPEPATWTLALAGLGGLAAFKFCSRRKGTKS
jgi:hypothetical protein